MASPNPLIDAENTPFLIDSDESANQRERQEEGEHESRRRVPVQISRRLYASHFLSTCNSRVFEFGSVLYLATILPGTLLPLSLYAFTRGLTAVLFAPAVGRYIDVGNRLQVVRISIVFERIAVALSCAVFYAMSVLRVSHFWKVVALVLVSLLACVEKLCSIMNLVSVEKDWVVVIAGQDQEALVTMNAQMRRIDLSCKLLGPLFIALIDGISTDVAIAINFGMNAASVAIEYYAIAQVYQRVPQLHAPKYTQERVHTSASDAEIDGETSWSLSHWIGSRIRTIRDMAISGARDTRFYTSHRAFLPSFACDLLYLTVLSFGGQMVTYLVASGYTSTQVGVARTLSVVLEVLATWAAPLLMERIGPVRAGLWLGNYQLTTLIAGTAVFWIFSKDPLVSASGLVVATILSRVGLRGFDMCTQVIVQEEVEPESRGAFSSVEASWQNAFELLSFASTAVFSRPTQFKWPSIISVAAVACATMSYARFVYARRGHLLHLEAMSSCFGEEKRQGDEQSISGRLIREDAS